MYEILEKEVFSDVTKMIVVSAPDVVHKAQAGQFVVVRVVDEGERIPLTIADFDRKQGTITMVFQEVGKSTMHLGTLQRGDALASLTGPLGRPTEIENYGTVICVGGGLCIALAYPHRP